MAEPIVELKSGERARLRLLEKGDGARLGDYFVGLSEATVRVYGPHRFDRETAAEICAGAGSDGSLRLLAVVGDDERIVGYFILVLGVRDGDRKRYEELGIDLDDERDATLAPSVADAYQSAGLGSEMMAYLMQLARQRGRRRLVLWGGVRADNPRAVHFYTKFGFEKKGEFRVVSRGQEINNYDMVAPL